MCFVTGAGMWIICIPLSHLFLSMHLYILTAPKDLCISITLLIDLQKNIVTRILLLNVLMYVLVTTVNFLPYTIFSVSYHSD